MGIFKRFDHVSIGVNDMDKAKALFLDILGGEELPDKGSSKEDFDWMTFMLGGKKMEVITPTSPDGGVGRYMEKYGEGYHHISIAVDSLQDAIDYFTSKGLRVLGVNFESENFKHCYLHPKDTFGAMIQVFEENPETEELAG